MPFAFTLNFLWYTA